MTCPRLAAAISLLVALASGCLSAAYASQEAEWYIGPRFGFSPATGVIGIEAQRGHLGLAAGAFCFQGCVPTTGVKYYLDETGDSWALGAFYWQGDDESDDSDDSFRFYGLSVEHRYRFGGGLELALGVGIGRLSGGESAETLAIFPTMQVGISF